jgi:hypothetical protein
MGLLVAEHSSCCLGAALRDAVLTYHMRPSGHEHHQRVAAG